MIELEMGERLRDARLVKEAETILDKAGAILDRDAAGRVLQNLVGTLPECGENGVQPRRADH